MGRGDFSNIPVLDVSPLRGGAGPEDRAGTVAELRRTLETIGFVYLADHGVPPELGERLHRLSVQFHDLPAETKLRLRMNDAHRGYMPFSTSTIVTSSVAAVTKPNQSESLMAMHDLAEDDPALGEPLQGPNQWPAEIPELRQAALDYMRAMSALGRDMAVAIAEALDLPPTYFLPHFDRPTLFLRLLHYPEQRREEGLFGSAPHTDYGFITLLAQDSVGGLEVRNRAGEWIPAPPIPNTFVMNVGDILARWSNDRFASTPHRVLNLSGRERYSQPFFYDPSMDSVVDCPAALLAPGEAPRQPPVRYGDYLLDRLNKNYEYRKKAS
ncbi:isopenicillin N synthase family oxygenase [Mycobacterium sp. KBS0706]|uniref:isopenicillin N synthase family dioxygenase n=1 Tax=Mycobacterium sp. KBS0706 TaxID=2578109 RepID=UPI00110F939D|nr:2OG-Fe(II) oxygenase family protein [Mycobacterium sp. KBS0706]TSD90571.1 isopenicillin N synthase family oxygenase [Mycobacterium sp. KBS0706]